MLHNIEQRSILGPLRDFPGSPLVKIHASVAGYMYSIPAGGT